MPARSVAQRKMMSIAEHDPEELDEKNQGVLSMSHSQMHDFASTKQVGLPPRAPVAKKPKMPSMKGKWLK